MPRLTNRVFTDLAIWMAGFGLVIGLVFPPFCLVVGLPSGQILTPLFFLSTIVAGLLVGAVNYGLARLVVAKRLRLVADRMTTVEARLAEAVFTHDWTSCDPSTCALPVDSADELGETAGAFNRLITTLSRSHAVETAMRAFSGVLSSQFELERLGHAALDALLAHTESEAGALLIVRDGSLEPLAVHGLRDPEGIATSDHIARAVRTGTTERIAIPAAGVVIDSLLVGHVAQEVLVAPVTFKSVPLGVVVLASSKAYAADACQLLEQFRADLGLAFNNALAHDRLERLAAIDPLTDAYNRRFGLARLREEFSRAIRAENPLGVLMLDLDHFKAVNDTYGHLVGDRLLRAAATTCRRVLREGDVLVRYGGEEFLVLLPGAGADDVLEIGERLRRAVGETTVPEGDQRIGATLSVGAAQYRDEIDSPEALLASADTALYEAKEAGRNRVVVA
jgi:two-component system cell cycle response regulator